MTNMSRFAGLIANTNFFVRKLKINLSLDFGSSQTRLIVDRKLVWNQPTLIAWHARLQSVVAIGHKAAALRGKAPAHIKLITPIQKGVIAELDYATYYLKAVLDQLRQQKKISPWIIANCRVALTANASPLEKDQMKQVLERAGFKVKKIMSQPEAVVALPSFGKITQSHGVIDFGAQTVNMGIFIGQQLFKGVTINSIVGDTFTQTIINQVLTEYGLQIGWEVAQQIKHQLSVSAVMTVRGKDAQTQLVKVVRVEAKKFKTQFYELAVALLLELKEIIDELPPEVVIQLQEQGFYLTGGGSRLSDWQDLISKSWQMPAIVSSSPALDVVKGLDHGE
jgi:rod shape-determining protein MreB and related proteins